MNYIVNTGKVIMALKETLIEGNSKRIFSASPLQVISLKKKYLREMPSGKIPEVLKQSFQEKYRLPSLPIRSSTIYLSQERQPIRKTGIKYSENSIKLRNSAKKKRNEVKITTTERLRLNNL